MISLWMGPSLLLDDSLKKVMWTHGTPAGKNGALLVGWDSWVPVDITPVPCEIALSSDAIWGVAAPLCGVGPLAGRLGPATHLSSAY